jgi:cellulose synthase/poly-beta-1,6-N-acetylglucosamine synthase-like glycosyltransferase
MGRGITIGICAYNEGENIGRLFANLLRDQGLGDEDEIIIVCSGCTDETVPIARLFAEADRRIKVIVEPERRGKASAVNLILREARGRFIVFLGADVIPGERAIARIAQRLSSAEDLGIVSGAPEPILTETLAEKISSIIWALHNRVLEALSGRIVYACGELYGVRRSIVESMPAWVVNDDAYVAKVAEGMGYRSEICSSAKVYIRAPRTITDYIAQRRRVTFGHLQLWRGVGLYPGCVENAAFKAPSLFIRMAIPMALGPPFKLPYFLAGMALEALAAILALMDILRGKSHSLWEIARTTKYAGPVTRPPP